jgi:hypothetical protein
MVAVRAGTCAMARTGVFREARKTTREGACTPRFFAGRLNNLSKQRITSILTGINRN